MSLSRSKEASFDLDRDICRDGIDIKTPQVVRVELTIGRELFLVLSISDFDFDTCDFVTSLTEKFSRERSIGLVLVISD